MADPTKSPRAWVVKGAVTYLTTDPRPYRTAQKMPPTLVVADSLAEALETYNAKAPKALFFRGRGTEVRVDSIVPYEEALALMIADSQLEKMR